MWRGAAFAPMLHVCVSQSICTENPMLRSGGTALARCLRERGSSETKERGQPPPHLLKRTPDFLPPGDLYLLNVLSTQSTRFLTSTKSVWGDNWTARALRDISTICCNLVAHLLNLSQRGRLEKPVVPAGGAVILIAECEGSPEQLG